MIRSLVTFATIEAAATQTATWSPFHIASAGHGEPRDLEAVGQHVAGARGQARERAPHPGHVADVQAEPVDLSRARSPPRARPAPTGRSAVRRFPGASGQHLGVGDCAPALSPFQRSMRDRRHDQRASAGAAAGLVDARDRPEASPDQHPLVAGQPVTAPRRVADRPADILDAREPEPSTSTARPDALARCADHLSGCRLASGRSPFSRPWPWLSPGISPSAPTHACLTRPPLCLSFTARAGAAPSADRPQP